MDIPHFVYSFTCGWTFGWIPPFGFCECRCGHRYANICLSFCFPTFGDFHLCPPPGSASSLGSCLPEVSSQVRREPESVTITVQRCMGSHLGKLQGAGRKEMPRHRQGRQGRLHGGELPTASGRATSTSRRGEWEGSHGGEWTSTAQSCVGDQTPRRRERACEGLWDARGLWVSTLGCKSSPRRPWTRRCTSLELDFLTCSLWMMTALTSDGIVPIKRDNT